jgi:hypothetical protein
MTQKPEGLVSPLEGKGSSRASPSAHVASATATEAPAPSASVGEQWRRKCRWNGYGNPRLWLAGFNRDAADETDFEVAYTYSPGCEAQNHGPPERCWPAEPAEVEIYAAFTESAEIDLTEAERERVMTWLIDNPPEDDYDPRED